MHISLDLWNSLISPNPSYSAARNWAIAKFAGVSYEEAASKYSDVKKYLDSVVAHCAHSTEKCWSLLCDRLQIPDKEKELEKLSKLLVEEYPPILDYKIVLKIQDLKKKGFTFNISSNTNFISGATLLSVLNNCSLGDFTSCFEFTLFSDQLGFAKPNKKFFEEIVKRINPRNKILHLGDDPATDGAAIMSGIKIKIIKNPEETLAYLNSL